MVADRALLPATSKIGRPRKWPMREVWIAIQYIAATGCVRAVLTRGIAPFTTVQHWFCRLRDSGMFDHINETLVMAERLLAGRTAAPTAGVIDSQSVKTTEFGGPRGYDAGKKVKGRKRQILTDARGNLPGGHTPTADIQDRDGAPDVIVSTNESFPTLLHLFTDGGYAGEKLGAAIQAMDGPAIEFVKRPDGTNGFVVIARRWVVERTFAWHGRRLAKDWEATIASANARLLIASIRRTARFVARA